MAAMARCHFEHDGATRLAAPAPLGREVGMRFAAEKPAAGHGLTRRAMLGGGMALTLAGCNSAGLEMPNDVGGPAATPAQPANAPTVGETMGTGPVRVGMVLPLTQNGAPSPIGASMRNAAQLAISDSGSTSITIMIQDDPSRPDGP